MSSNQATVVVTGASTGIGLETALYLAQRGFIVIAGVRKEKDIQAWRERNISQVEPIILDITNRDHDQHIEQAMDRLGLSDLHGIVNNAGIAVAGPLEFIPEEDLRQQLEVNVTAQILITQAVLPKLRKTEGRVVFVGSTSGFLTPPFVGAYCMSKYAIESAADALRRELHPWRMHVALVQPGAIATPIWDKSTQAADELLEKLPARAHEFYGQAFIDTQKQVESVAKRAIPATKVAQVIHHALTHTKPKTRYLVGIDAYIQKIIARVLSDRMADKVLTNLH